MHSFILSSWPPCCAPAGGLDWAPRDSSDYDTLFEIADKRLYEAKAAGRNRVVGPEKFMRLIQAR
jgi:PleD family two-component response regulator